jgi:DnaJ domain
MTDTQHTSPFDIAAQQYSKIEKSVQTLERRLEKGGTLSLRETRQLASWAMTQQLERDLAAKLAAREEQKSFDSPRLLDRLWRALDFKSYKQHHKVDAAAPMIAAPAREKAVAFYNKLLSKDFLFLQQDAMDAYESAFTPPPLTAQARAFVKQQSEIRDLQRQAHHGVREMTMDELDRIRCWRKAEETEKNARAEAAEAEIPAKGQGWLTIVMRRLTGRDSLVPQAAPDASDPKYGEAAKAAALAFYDRYLTDIRIARDYTARIEEELRQDAEKERRQQEEARRAAQRKQSGPDYYSLLEVEHSVTDDDLKRAWKRLALKNHPDRNPGNPGVVERFKDIARAYSVLSNAEQRRNYDMFGVAS